MLLVLKYSNLLLDKMYSKKSYAAFLTLTKLLHNDVWKMVLYFWENIAMDTYVLCVQKEALSLQLLQEFGQ